MALRQMLVFPGCRVLPSPLLQIAGAREHFDADGNLSDDEVREQVVGVLEAFATWIRQVG
jgi:NAD(P)H-dependent FMN reductase